MNVNPQLDALLFEHLWHSQTNPRELLQVGWLNLDAWSIKSETAFMLQRESSN